METIHFWISLLQSVTLQFNVLTEPSPACNYNLTSIQPALTVNATRVNALGFWGHDASRNDGIIYLAEDDSHIDAPCILKEYLSEAHLQQDLVHKVHSLPRPCSRHRLASVIRDRHFIYADEPERQLMMFNLDTDRLVIQKNILKAARLDNVYWRVQKVDLCADDSWVWMVYAYKGQNRMLLHKLDPQTLDTVATWETHIPRLQIDQTFMIHGVLYSLSSTDGSSSATKHSPSSINYIYSTRDGESRTLEDGELVMPTARKICPFYMARLITLNYDHWDQALYAWNCGYVEKYPVELAQQCT